MASLLNSADLDAINRYMISTPYKNQAARKLQYEWAAWYNNLSFLDKYSDDVRKEATNRRNAFNIANTSNPAELNTVKQVIARGVSAEESRGEKRITDSAGNYPDQKGVTVLSAAKGSVPKGARPTIRQGSKGDTVKAWQAILGVKVDGNFGSNTRAATVAWQSKHGLKPDGIVGSGTWSAALASTPNSNMPAEVAAVTPVAPVGVPAAAVPVGAVIPTASIKQPATQVAQQPVKKAAVVTSVSETPPEDTRPATAVVATTAASMLPLPAVVKDHPITSGIIASGIGYAIKKLFF